MIVNMGKSDIDLAFAGLYAKLKDRNTSLADKLQVFRFAWKSKDVFIPNKEQVLIDQLCGYLLNKKKHQFTEEETGKIFKCLHDVLISKKAHQKQEDGQGLLVKQSLSQMLTDTLWLKLDCELTDEDYQQHVLGCCHAIVTSQTLAYVFTDRLDLMVSLQGCLCCILYKKVTNGKEDAQLDKLLEDTTDLFVRCQDMAHNQNRIMKVTLEKLLPHFVKVYAISSSEEVKRLTNVVLKILCHRDHSWSYTGYLLGVYEDKLPDEADFTRIELINQLFKTFTHLLENEDIGTEVVCDLLVKFYEKFVENKRSEEDLKVAHYLLRKVSSLIGLNETDSALKGTVAPPIGIKGIGKLLEVVLKHDLYNVVIDNRSGHKQLKFYRIIVRILLDNVCQSADWYSCCHTLLKMNHHTIEPSLVAILMKGWISLNEMIQDGAAAQIDDLLQELITTYHKLRQFPKIIDVLIDVLKHSSGNVEFPPKFVKSYGESVQSLPQATMVTILSKYTDHMIHEFGTEKPISNSSHFQAISQLLYYYITNVKVIDFSVTELTLNSVKDNLEKMSSELFLPLLKEQANSEKTDPACLRSILDLCHGWGEVVAMVTMYTQYNMEELRTRPVSRKPDDVTYLHSYLRKKYWKLLYKKIQMAENMCLHYYWDMLMVQKIRTILLCRDLSEWSVIHESMETLIKFPAVVSQASLKETWSGKIDDINDNNILVARWQLVVNNLPILYTNLSQENMENLASFIVNTASPSDQLDRKDAVSLCSITRDLLLSSEGREYGGLMTCIITAIWHSLSDCMVGSTSRSKKRKSAPVLEAAVHIFRALSDTDVDWKTSINSESLEKILEASRLLTTLLKSQEKEQTEVQKTSVTCCLQIISQLPLEHIPSSDQIRCLIGLLSLKSLLNQSVSKECTDLSEECIRLCTVILESSGMSPIFQVIDMEIYLTWLGSFLKNHSKMDSSFFKMLLFIEFSCISVVKDYKVLVKLPEFVQKIQVQISSKSFDPSSETGLLVLSMYLLQGTNRMLSRQYLNESLQESCRLIQNGLTKAVLSLTPRLQPKQYSCTEALIVNTFSTMVYSSGKDDTLHRDIMSSVPSVLEWCKHVLQEDVDVQLFPSLAALHFLNSASRCHQSLGEVLPADRKHQIWNLLVDLLRDLLKRNQRKINPSDERLKMDGLTESEADEPDTKYRMISDLLSDTPHMLDTRSAGNTSLTCTTTNPLNLTSDTSVKDFPNQKVYRSSEISNLYHSLVFEGRLQDQSTSLLMMEVQTVMATLLASFDLDNFTSIIQRIVDDVQTCKLTTDRSTIQCYLFVWQYLLRLEFSAEHSQIIRSAAEKIVSNCQCILQQVQHHEGQNVVIETVLPILQAQYQMLNISSRFLSAKSVALCLQGCVSLTVEGATLFPVFHAMCNILDSLLIKHINTVLQNIPTFISCTKKLLVSLVKHSDQKGLAGDVTTVSNLSNSTYKLERLFLEISNHKVDFNKVAVYVIADYVTAVEKVTLLPSLKRALLPVIYKMLDLCDNFAISQLHKILNYGQVEVFRILYNEYNKYHKFSGKV